MTLLVMSQSALADYCRSVNSSRYLFKADTYECCRLPGGGVSHGEGGAARPVLGLDHLGARVLDPLSQRLQGVSGELHSGGALNGRKIFSDE